MFFAFICCALTCGAAVDDFGAVRIATYNIRFSFGDKETVNSWVARRDDLVSFLKRLDADAGGLQEVCPDQARYLRDHLSDYAIVGEHRESDRVSGEASPVFYRKSRFVAEKEGTFWLSETPDAPGVKGWGAACPRVCSYAVLKDVKTGRRFCLANTHTDNKSALAREKGMLLVIERIKEFGGGLPIVFTGDHNCRETDAPALAVSRFLKNAMLVSETKPKGSWRTFNGWRWRDVEVSAEEALKLSPNVRNCDKAFYERCGGSRIDYIYVSQDICVRSFETVNESRPGTKLYPSDHFPVVVTLDFGDGWKEQELARNLAFAAEGTPADQLKAKLLAVGESANYYCEKE